MPSLQTLELGRDGAVATVTLNRPKALNAWNELLAQELCATLGRLARDETVRA